jgi:hypothetical protein
LTASLRARCLTSGKTLGVSQGLREDPATLCKDQLGLPIILVLDVDLGWGQLV